MVVGNGLVSVVSEAERAVDRLVAGLDPSCMSTADAARAVADVARVGRKLAESGRLAPRVVLLAPPAPSFRQALGRLPFTVAHRHVIRLLGRPATIWVLDRRVVREDPP